MSAGFVMVTHSLVRRGRATGLRPFVFKDIPHEHF